MDIFIPVNFMKTVENLMRCNFYDDLSLLYGWPSLVLVLSQISESILYEFCRYHVIKWLCRYVYEYY